MDESENQDVSLLLTYYQMHSIRQAVEVGFASFHQGWRDLHKAPLAKFAVLQISRVEGHGSIDAHVLNLRRRSTHIRKRSTILIVHFDGDWSPITMVLRVYAECYLCRHQIAVDEILAHQQFILDRFPSQFSAGEIHGMKV